MSRWIQIFFLYLVTLKLAILLPYYRWKPIPDSDSATQNYYLNDFLRALLSKKSYFWNLQKCQLPTFSFFNILCVQSLAILQKFVCYIKTDFTFEFWIKNWSTINVFRHHSVFFELKKFKNFEKNSFFMAFAKLNQRLSFFLKMCRI